VSNLKEEEMSKNIVKWIVEEVDSLTGIRNTKEFNSYDEALDVYNDLKIRNEHNSISLEKANKKLLIE
jgi:hypothetical protein